MFKKIAIASDHNGEEYKHIVASTLEKLGVDYVLPEYKDSLDNDYPDVIKNVYELFKTKQVDGLILLCGTGVGMCMGANKLKGVRCVWANDTAVATFGRIHEDANALALGVNYQDKNLKLRVSMKESQIKKVIEAFVTTSASNEVRHKRRIKKLDNLIDNKTAKE